MEISAGAGIMEVSEVVIRPAAAAIVGAAIGLNRDLRGKPTGVRTLGIVAPGSALIVMASGGFAPTPSADSSAVRRTIQGLITGIGCPTGSTPSEILAEQTSTCSIVLLPQ